MSDSLVLLAYKKACPEPVEGGVLHGHGVRSRTMNTQPNEEMDGWHGQTMSLHVLNRDGLSVFNPVFVIFAPCGLLNCYLEMDK